MLEEKKETGAIKGEKTLAEDVEVSKEELEEKEKLQDEMKRISAELVCVCRELEVCQARMTKIEMAMESENPKEVDDLLASCGSREELGKKIDSLKAKKTHLDYKLEELKKLSSVQKDFDKNLCFSNIRFLLKQNQEVKIGQIEKEAGFRLGYMSRLEKEGNSSEPSIEFVATAAKLLHVSIDSLLFFNFSKITPTEHYVSKFFNKLMSDTLKDKLDWNRETPFDLNRLELDINGQVYHPLFSEETFIEETETGYPQEVTRIVFNSKTFGPKTCIAGDCFNLRLKNGTTFYLMDIEKSVHKTGDLSAYAKEAWIYVPARGSQFLVASQDGTPIAPTLEELFATVKERMEHPKVNRDAMYAIDAYMRDDIQDDEICFDNLPF